jgi:hypothetical protein
MASLDIIFKIFDVIERSSDIVNQILEDREMLRRWWRE